jgi:CheY-like chemotaxis protein
VKIYLLVEDCQDDVFLTEHAFLRSGMARKAKLRIVRDGLQAIDYVQGVPPYDNRATFPFPDYILADIKMPHLNGLQLLKWLQEHQKLRPIPVILTSGRELGPEEHDLIKSRAIPFLPKPIDWSAAEALL